jgi:hypothetical protein
MVSSLRQRVAMVEWVPWFDHFLDYEVDVRDGVVQVPDVIGSGFSPNLEVLEVDALSPWIALP